MNLDRALNSKEP